MILKKQILFLVVVLLGFPSHGLVINKPNILVIWGDDIGLWHLSSYNMGLMGSRPQISTANRGLAK